MGIADVQSLIKDNKLEEAIQILQSMTTDGKPDDVSKVEAYYFLANIYGNDSKFTEAKDMTLKAAELAHKLTLKVEEVQALALYGTLSMRSDNVLEGIARLEENIILLEGLDYSESDAELVAGLYNNALGTLYQEKGDFDIGVNYAERALEHFESSGNKVQLSRALYNLGVGYSHRGKTDHAMMYLKRAALLQSFHPK